MEVGALSFTRREQDHTCSKGGMEVVVPQKISQPYTFPLENLLKLFFKKAFAPLPHETFFAYFHGLEKWWDSGLCSASISNSCRPNYPVSVHFPLG